MPKSNPELAVAMGNRMATRRKELKLTQEAVAELAGIAHQQYNKAENGKVCFGADTLLRVSRALQTSADYLLSGKEGTRYCNIEQLLDRLTDSQVELATEMIKCIARFEVASGSACLPPEGPPVPKNLL